MRTLTFLAVTVLLVSSAAAASGVDEYTTFLATFDRSVAVDYCRGDWRVAIRPPVRLVPGKFGQALSLDERQRLIVPAAGKIDPKSGTIELWLQVAWQPPQLTHLSILSFHTPSNCYLNFNAIGPRRLGVAVQGGPPDKHVWRRVDVDPSGWRHGEWHYLAATWEGGTLSLYADGKLVNRDTQGAAMADVPEEFLLGPGPLVVDHVRISAWARSAQEIRQRFEEIPHTRGAGYLTDLKPSGQKQVLGRVGLDCQYGLDDRRLPLMTGGRAYARGLALRAPGWVEFALPARTKRLVCYVGASALGEGKDAVQLLFRGDGQVLKKLGPLHHGDEPQRIELELTGHKTLRVEAPAGGGEGVAVVADPLLLAGDDRPPAPFAREASKDELELQRMRARIGRVRFDLAPAPKGYVLYKTHPVDIFDLDREPTSARSPKALELTAAPGEWEGAEVAICAAVDLPRLSLTTTALKGPTGQIPPDAVQVKLVRRVLQRRGYWMKRKPENFEAVPRFLFPNREFWLPAGHVKEAYVLVHVPVSAAPGSYEGELSLRADGHPQTVVTLRLQVWPFKLAPPAKRYGMYYNLPQAAQNPRVLHAELSDMAAHGCTTLYTYAGITFSRAEPQGNITWSYDQIRGALAAMREHGFHGPVVIGDGIMQLARLLEVRGVQGDDTSDAMAKAPELLQTMDAALHGLKKVAAEYPQFELVLTHMDEVFNRGRMPRFLDAARVVRRTPGFRFYETLHMMPGRWEKFMKQCDEYVDVRCINGHSLDEWLKAGHTFDDLAALLKASGDEGWTYYNMRGSFFCPEWNRIVNGLYLWASPLTTHVPWMYNSYGGDPFDDTDSARYDFGYAFPSPGDSALLVSTLHWEAFREGCDDVRYLTTLDKMVHQAQRKGVDASSATSWLHELKGRMPRPRDIAGISLESPVLVFLAQKYSGADWDALRSRTAREIIKLQRKLGG